MAHFEMLSAEQRDTAHAALRRVLGTVPIDEVIRLSGGATSAAVLRVEAGGHRYVLRIEGQPSPLRNPHQYASLRIAAEAGIAPRIHDIDEDDRVTVIDFIEPWPLGSFPGGPRAQAQALGHLLQRLQSTPAFPYFVDYPDIVARLWAHVCRTGLFAPGVLDAANQRLAEIRQSYIWDRAHSLSSHNDSIPANILFDGERLWMIDWESAYRNDPLVDVAIISDNLARTPELEETLLCAWIGRRPDDALRNRLKLTRALTRLYYAGVFFSASATIPRAAPDASVSAPALAAFRGAIADGRLKPGTPVTKHVLGKMYLASFLTDAPTPGFDAAA
jgi:hypothetical protein